MIRGELFTRYFLDDGIREMDHYRRLAPAEAAAFAEAIREHWAHLEQMPHPSEAETEADSSFRPSAFLAGNTCRSKGARKRPPRHS